MLCDPNILACKDHMELLQQLVDSKAKVDFNQGVDIRLINERNAKLISKIKVESIHFAYDRYEDKELIEPKFKEFRKASNVNYRNLRVYVLIGDRQRKVLPEDLHRIYFLRENGFDPYVMIYNKEELPRSHELKDLQRWVNNKIVFWSVPKFEDYKR